jgi:predicted RNA binding protein YcfA (HicA-like mRNA interferase family)
MPRFKVLSGRQVRAILEANGFVFVRQRGSHMIMERVTDSGTISASVPDHREVRVGTLQNIIQQSGLPRSLFMTQ